MTSAVKPPSTLIRQVHVVWTKAWFNGRDKGEKAIEINRQLAIKFINDEILLDDWLARFYPKQMNVCHKAIEQARKQLLGI